LTSHDEDAELRTLLQERDIAAKEYNDFFSEKTTMWQLRYGPIHLRRSMNSGAVTGVFITSCGCCFLLGVVLALLESTRELGVALVVGSILAFGSFAIQIWAIQTQKEFEFGSGATAEEDRRHLRELRKNFDEVIKRIEALSPGYFDSTGKA
jgi:hypothetical protein